MQDFFLIYFKIFFGFATVCMFNGGKDYAIEVMTIMHSSDSLLFRCILNGVINFLL